MAIAVTYENGNIFQHFGHTAQFKVCHAEDSKVIPSLVVDTNGSGHGALAGLPITAAAPTAATKTAKSIRMDLHTDAHFFQGQNSSSSAPPISPL